MTDLNMLNLQRTDQRINSILKRQTRVLEYKSRTNSEERTYIIEEPEDQEENEEKYPHLYQKIKNYAALSDHTTRNTEEQAMYIPLQQIGIRI